MAGDRILAVDDDPAVLDALVELLLVDGHEVERASCTEEALEVASTREVDLVITDLVMPGPCGLQLIQLLHQRWPGLPVLLITGTQGATGFEAEAEGAVETLTKPIEVGQLRSILRRLLPHAGPDAEDRSRLRSAAPTERPQTIEISIGTRMQEIERQVIYRTLEAMGWNKNRTARALGISRRSLYDKLARYEIPPRELGLLPKRTGA